MAKNIQYYICHEKIGLSLSECEKSKLSIGDWCYDGEQADVCEKTITAE